MLRFYRRPALSASAIERVLQVGARLAVDTQAVNTEWCYYIVTSGPFENGGVATLQWLLGETFEPENLSET